jgi:hypothetical protein
VSLPYEGDSSDPNIAGIIGKNSAGGIGVSGIGDPAGFFQGDVAVTGNVTAQDIILAGQISVGSTPNPGAVVVNDSQGNAGVKLNGGTVGGSISVAGTATIGDTLSVTGKVSAFGDLAVAGKLTATSLAGDGAGLNNVTAKDSSITSAKLNSLTDQVQVLTAQVNQLAGDLNSRFQQLNDRVDAIVNMINATGKIVDMKVAFGVDGGPGALVFTSNQDYKDSQIKTTHTGVISGDVIFMVAMVHGYSSTGGPGVARGRIIRTSSGGFDVFGTEDVIFRVQGLTGGVVTFAGDPKFGGQDVTGGGTLMIAATADGSGTYDCRVQIAQKVPGFGAMQLQHMMSLVFRPAA